MTVLCPFDHETCTDPACDCWCHTPLSTTIEPVGLAEIAERLGVKRGTVDVWRRRGRLPEPRWTVGGRPAWDWADIVAWAERTGRRRDDD